jgi:centromere/kinetochore protein ZW10
MCNIYYTGLATLGEDPNITPGIEKAVRQCLRQLELLQTVWMDVLPATVYCKALGEIIVQQWRYVCYFRKQNH